jgi:hypothetical protein
VTAADAYDVCVSGIGSEALSAIFKAHRVGLLALEASVSALGQAGELYTIAPLVITENNDPVVFGSLTKSQLVKLYSDYLVPSSKPGRRVYDALLVRTPKCPFCGGVGQSFTLDHYLPKTKFPQFSVLPINLVPCCRDCNSSKGTGVATRKCEQVLHPYLDGPQFFDTAWLSAAVVQSDPIRIDYSATPPLAWSADDRERVAAHMREHRLAFRFSREAASDLVEVMYERQTHLAGLSAVEYRLVLQDKAIFSRLGVNHWRRVMYRALSESDWFCNL